MQDYDKALNLAEQNYRDYPENLYHMQAYFDCLIYRPELSEQQNNDIGDIIKTAESIYRTKSSEIYFELKAKYAAFIEHDKERALEILKEGSLEFKNSFYLYKEYFDICRKYDDIQGMEKAYSNLSVGAHSKNATYKSALLCRKAYLDAYHKVPLFTIQLYLRKDKCFTDSAVDNILRNVEEISNKNL